jgi:O-antigen/teichoic acid export membrane protein
VETYLISRLSLRVNFSWTVAGNIVASACAWGILIVLAKLGSPELVGRLALGISISVPVFFSTDMGLRWAQVTDALANYSFEEYMGLRISTVVVALVSVVSIIWVANYEWQTALVILLFSMAKAFESLSDIIHGLFQKKERMDRIARAVATRGVLSLVTFAMVFYFTEDLPFAVLAIGISYLSIFVAYDLPGARLFAAVEGRFPVPRFTLRRMLRLWWVALPLGIVLTLNSLSTNVPRYFIESMLGEEALGRFAAMAYIVVVGNTVVIAANGAALPRLSSLHAEGKTVEFNNLVFRLLLVGVALGICILCAIVLFGETILTVVYSDRFVVETNVFVLIVLGGAVVYLSMILGTAITARRQFRIPVPIHTVNLSLTALLCWALVGDYGLTGAAIALLVSALFVTASFAFVVYGPMKRN